MPDTPTAQVVVLAGPSGAGKTHLADRLGIPVLRLDDFYKDGDDPSLPRIVAGPNAGLPDWDDPRSWHREEALAALTALCRAGRADVPYYDIAHDGRSGTHTIELGGWPIFVAEGIFAQHVARPLRAAGLLAGAYCVTQRPIVTFWRRLVRDVREHRKPLPVLLRRGLALRRQQRSIVEDAVAHGCTAATPHEIDEAVRPLVRAARGARAPR